MKTITIFYDKVNNMHVTLVCEDETGELKVDHISTGWNLPRETPEYRWETAARLVGMANVKLHLITEWEPPADLVLGMARRFWGDGPQSSEER